MNFDLEGLVQDLVDYYDEAIYVKEMGDKYPEVVSILEELVAGEPELAGLLAPIIRTHVALVKCFDKHGTLFICGNGGSHADSLHIVGELLKSFERDRSLTEEQKKAFSSQPDGELLADNLEQGLRAYALGGSGPLATAIHNDNEVRDINYAQELFAMAKPGDVLMGISTGGGAKNVLYAVQVAKALGLTTVGMVGNKGGKLSEMADIVIKTPERVTKLVQEQHLPIYHALCAMIEAHYFPKKRS